MIALRLMSLVALLSSGSLAVAQAPKTTDRPPLVDNQTDSAKAEKRIAFEMRDKPWRDMIEWFVDRSGMAYIGEIAAPAGSFNFISPKGATYTIAEIIDIINAGLRQKQFHLVRNASNQFTLIPADLKVNPEWAPRIPLTELEHRGKTEIVSVVLRLKYLNVDECAPDVKKMMSSFGELQKLERVNQLILQDTAGSLRQILETIQAVDNEEGGHEGWSHKCLYVKAADAERLLRDYFGAPPANAAAQPANPAVGRGEAIRPAPRVGVHAIASSETNNTIFVNGRPDKIAQAKAVIAKLDVSLFPNQKPLSIDPPLMQTYNVPSGNAEALVKLLTDLPAYRPTSSFRMQAMSSTQVMVWANLDGQFDVARQLQATKGPPIVVETIQLSILESPKVAESLKAMFPLDVKSGGGPYIESDASRNVILVRGSSEQIAQIKSIVQSIEIPALQNPMRVITLERGSAATLADALRQVMPLLRDNPVNVIYPGAAGSLQPAMPPARTPGP